MQALNQTGLPVRAALGPSDLHIALRDIAPDELHDAFMQETVNRLPGPHTLVQIPRAELATVPADTAPAGLIFHVARCGSTLVSQLLKLRPPVVVYSEPLPFNEVLVPPHKWGRGELIGALRALGVRFARHAGGPYVLKLTSWNTLFCDIIADAFPTTPWVICVRDPVEVCVSLLQQRPGWLQGPNTPSDLFANIVDPARSSRDAEDYVARLYGAFCRTAAGLDSERGLLIPYETLPDAVWDAIGPHFGLPVANDVRSRMSAASQHYSKAPPGKATQFVRDDAKKRAAASVELLRAVDAFARPEVERLTARLRDRQATRP